MESLGSFLNVCCYSVNTQLRVYVFGVVSLKLPRSSVWISDADRGRN